MEVIREIDINGYICFLNFIDIFMNVNTSLKERMWTNTLCPYCVMLMFYYEYASYCYIKELFPNNLSTMQNCFISAEDKGIKGFFWLSNEESLFHGHF